MATYDFSILRELRKREGLSIAQLKPEIPMLHQRFPKDFLHQHLLAQESWRPFPPAADRDAWTTIAHHALGRQRRQQTLDDAARLLATTLPVIPVSRYFDFVRDGNRQLFENLYFARRQRLSTFALAACFDPDRRFLEAAVDTAWAICEESSWALSAHVARRHQGADIMPDLSLPTVALFSCQTAAILAEMSFLLGAELDHLSPAIRERIGDEILRRIILPFEQRDDFWWLAGRNNWTPWCVSSILVAACHLLSDRKRLATLISRSLAILDRYLDQYPADGCCDEGPGYWGVSPGALLMALEMIHSRTNAAVNPYDEPQIADLARYIRHVHLSGPWFFNYADCPPSVRIDPARVYRFGQRIGDPQLQQLAIASLYAWPAPEETKPAIPPIKHHIRNLLDAIRELSWIPGNIQPTPLPPSPCDWYPDGQILVARTITSHERGLVLGVKGGHNGENHNHNDLGEFIVVADGQPVIVDPGGGTYCRQTFSHERYTIWCNAGRGHDVLQFGEHEQAPGKDFHSHVIRQHHGADETVLELELANAYPPTAGVHSWRRTSRLTRTGNCEIRIADQYELSTPLPVSFPLFTTVPPNLTEGRAEFPLDSGRRLIMTWQPAVLDIAMAELETQDPALATGWGTTPSRLICRFLATSTNAQHELSFIIPGANA